MAATFVALLTLLLQIMSTTAKNTTYTNPILPGFNPDPSCAFHPPSNTTLCTTSSFLTFPGIPVFASRDLQHWKLASHALTRAEQLPELHRPSGQAEGLWAATIRYHEGVVYLITGYVSWYAGWAPQLLLFTSTDPFDDDSWTGPLRVENPANDIDPDLFWDEGKVYMSVAAGMWVSELNLETGAASTPFRAWNGTGDRNPEGPHFYKKDGWYYLLIGEGGTELNHTATLARAKSIEGPYEPYPGNPLLSAKKTENFFQTVGHADFFKHADGQWWGVALATRSGPKWEVYPMGRETVLYPVTWEEGEWPVVEQIRGPMEAPLPPKNLDVPGDGPWAHEGDEVDFRPGTKLPRWFLTWRPRKESLFEVSAKEKPNALKIVPSRVNLTADAAFEPEKEGMAFISRKQSASIFTYSVDLSFEPKVADEEAGVTVFLTQVQHIDLGIVNLASGTGNQKQSPKFRFRVDASGKPDATAPPEKVTSIPPSWIGSPIRLNIASTKDGRGYVFSASSPKHGGKDLVLGTAGAEIVSGGAGPFHGTLIGAYATSNGGKGSTPAYVSRWRYRPLKQEIDAGKFVSA